MAVTLGELIRQLRKIAETNGDDLMVVTDFEQPIEAAEYSEEDDSPACVLVVGEPA